VLWVDAFVEYRDPGARQLLYALPRLQAEGWKVSIWCLRSDAPRESVDHIFLPALPLPGSLRLLWFGLIANLYGAWRWLSGQPRPAEIIHANCGLYFPADLVSVHFLNCVWLRKHLALGFESLKEVAQFLIHCGGAIFERLQWWSPWTRKALPVSDSVGAEVRLRCRSQIEIETLPNAYDETRFNRDIRATHRLAVRDRFGWSEGEIAFAFMSLGHHKRKGFWLAVEALASLRAEGHGEIRFLVIGGLPPTLAALQHRLDRSFAGWREWIVFTGAQPAVEPYLAAADAFFYPSYFEAFCLAEIEAAALGLPLLLTPHHGSEMILRDGVNGCLLSFEPAQMAGQLRRFLERGAASFRYDIGQALTRTAYAERLLAIYESLRLSQPPQPPQPASAAADRPRRAGD